MRKIKFRAWIKKEKRMDDVDFINFAAQFAGKWECKKPDADLFSDRGDEVATRRGRLFNFEDVEIMQFTGLKDKNGKEIYEGDIVAVTIDRFKAPKNKLEKVVIVWEHAGFKMQKIPKQPIRTIESHLSKYIIEHLGLEVIGNVFEDPGLLENEK